MWKLTHRAQLNLIEEKDKLFHQHIKRNRVDPSTQSTTNPVPDFYGEKIGSMKEYRQWLRDQVCMTVLSYESCLMRLAGEI